MKIGSLFSGIGGLDVAVEHVFQARTAWQLDLVGADVRRRHWPDALQVASDVRTVDPLALPPIDVLCGGFPCVDLSCAGPQPENPLDTGDRSGLYQEILRFTREIRPRYVVVENVLKLRKLLPRVSRDFRVLGYGLSWCVCEAADAGAPHLRRRVFLLAERGAIGRGEVQADAAGRWTPDSERTWTTPTAMNPNETETPETWEARRKVAAEKHGTNGIGEPLGQQVRTWGTSRISNDGRGSARADDESRLEDQAVVWSTPCGSDGRRGSDPRGAREGSPGLVEEVRIWATPTAMNPNETETPETWEALSQAAANGKRLSPDWTETLMGFPVGWTLPAGPRLEVDPSPRWPRGRYPETWDRSIPWPGYDWEPARTLPDGPPCPGRPARIRALGNAVVPQQAILALRSLL